MKCPVLFKFGLLSFFLVSCGLYPIKTVHNSNGVLPTESKEKKSTEGVQLVVAPPSVVVPNDHITDEEISKYSYEVGLDPKKGLTPEETKQVLKRKHVRILERSLDSQKERYNYSRVLPWLLNDDEKVVYLSIASIEGRQAWINKNKIWKRSKNTKEYQDIMETMDIAIGMPTDFVKKAWGEPELIENSGNPIYKNERWKYIKQVSTPNGYHQEKRFVYFEGGRVVGWETE